MLHDTHIHTNPATPMPAAAPRPQVAGPHNLAGGWDLFKKVRGISVD